MKKPELKEQSKFVSWLRQEGHKVSSINNGAHAATWNQRAERRMAGTERGLPDLMIIFNEKYREDKKPLLIFVEMKRADGKGRTSPEQKEWIDRINASGAYASVCHGFLAAKAYIDDFYQVMTEEEKIWKQRMDKYYSV